LRGQRWQISGLTRERLDAVLGIEAVSFQYPWSRPLFEQELSAANALSYVVIGADGRSILAYMCLRVVLNEMHVLKIAVAPPWRRRGLGAALMQWCVQLARQQGLDQVWLEVRRSNAAAQLFYHELDFQIVGTRPRYYTDTGEDALILMRTISKEAP
jgi:ribosomal-protein-alanine N-acetyltransferase